MKKQVILIGGGTVFGTYKEFLNFLRNMEVSIEYLQKVGWKDTLQEKLGSDFDVVKLKMPNNMNAKYEEWKIYFEKYTELFDNEIILIGHSLGGIFLVKYLSENVFPKKNKSTLSYFHPIR